jgi:signal transduction histidine kinase
MPERPARPPFDPTPSLRRRASDFGPLPDRERLDQMAERARHAVTAREEERRRLAAELHDVAGANLATIKLNLSSLARAIPAAAVQEAQWMDDTQSLLSETIASIRELCSALRPSVLDQVLLVDALLAHCLRFSRRTGLEVALDMGAYDRPCPPDTELMLLRVTQEALWNCAKHAQARRVRIWFENVGSRRRFSILDDGLGFDPGQIRAAEATHGIGILNMQERALSAGALFSLESSPGNGTLIRLDF